MLAIKPTCAATASRAQRVRVVAARASSSMQPNLPQTPTRKSIVSNVAMVPDAREVTSIPLMPSGEPYPVELAAPPPFTLQDLRNAIPKHCWEKNTWRSMAFLALDVGIVAAIAFVAYTFNNCGHQSFSNNKTLNDLVGNITHASILVPYHGWRISHRTHHANHGHVENDESWHPVSKKLYDDMNGLGKAGRLELPWALFAYPFYLWKRSPGKEGSHYDPECDLFTKQERNMVLTSDAFMIGMVGILAACTYALGPWMMFKLYMVPYWINVVWLDIVTYLHHHGSSDPNEKIPWYRGDEWSYLRGGLSTIDRDYGIFNKIHHDIGTHVIHHLFPQIPHYHLEEATEACKPVMGKYYREPEPSPGPLPLHLIEPLVRSFRDDKFVDDEGDVVLYKSEVAAVSK